MKESSDWAWIDLEMTGLNPEHDVILEIAVVISNADLTQITEGPSIAIHQPDALLAGMDAWNTRQHGNSGLIDRVKTSTVTVAAAEEAVLAFLKQHVGEKKSPMCGNSIYQDRRFLVKYMPRLEAYFHYRNVDVSTLKELAKRWKPEVYANFKKESRHLAMEDIKESIEELRYYRDTFLKL